jgi:hypothetical protein
MPWFSYELCKGFITKTCEERVNLNQCAQHCSLCVTTCPSLEFDPSQDWTTCFCLSGCILSCFEVSNQNLSDPISEIAFSRVWCESPFRYIGSDWLKSDIGPSESPNADLHAHQGDEQAIEVDEYIAHTHEARPILDSNMDVHAIGSHAGVITINKA